MRRCPGARAGTALLLVALAACAGSDAPAERPDVLLILVDDLGWGDVSYLGGDLPTPRIDGLARAGLALDRFYASPMCTPSRAQFLSGRYAARAGLDRNVKWREERGLPSEDLTLAEVLGAAGYDTALVGKWHLGQGRAEHPNAQGFASFYGHLSGWIDYGTHLREGVVDWQRNGRVVEEEGYTTTLIADEAVRLLAASDARRPLFLMVSFNAPHPPLHVPPGRSLDPDQDPERAAYGAMVAELDRAIGRVLDAMDERAQRGAALVWFASDNGGAPRFGGSNAPLRGDKYTTLEGGLRVPSVLSWPGHVEPGRSEQVLANLDVLPTIAEAVGLTLPPRLDGVSAWEALRTGNTRERPDLFFSVRQRTVLRTALLNGPLKLIRERTLPDGTMREELYDVFADPCEEIDLAPSLGDRRRELAQRLDRLEAELLD